MGDQSYRASRLSVTEIQQLQRSLQSGSVREVALTVCTIKHLAREVRSILADLFSDEQTRGLDGGTRCDIPLPTLPSQYSFPGASSSYLPHISGNPPVPVASGSRLWMKKVRRIRCSHCHLTFSTRSSVNRHKKSVHGLLSLQSNTAPPEVMQIEDASSNEVPLATNTQSASDSVKSSTLCDTSVATPTPQKSSAPLPDQGSHDLSAVNSSDEMFATMPSIGDIMSMNQSIKEEPSSMTEPPESPQDSNQDKAFSVEPGKSEFMDSDNLHSQSHSEAQSDQVILISESQTGGSGNSLFPPPMLVDMGFADRPPEMHMTPGSLSEEEQDRIKAAVDESLKILPPDGFYKCCDCSWKSKSSDAMRAHILSHKNIMPYECHICKYKTNKKHVMKRHLSVHTGTKPHNCAICNFGSLDHIELYKHMNKSHPGIHPFTCTMCGVHTCTQLLLRKHMKMEHNHVPKNVGPTIPTTPKSKSAGPPQPSTSSVSPSSQQPKTSQLPPFMSTAPQSYSQPIPSLSSTMYSSNNAEASQPVFPQFSSSG